MNMRKAVAIQLLIFFFFLCCYSLLFSEDQEVVKTSEGADCLPLLPSAVPLYGTVLGWCVAPPKGAP